MATSPLAGQILGRYRIVKKIGEGGMGVVYLAHDERLDREVALKVLPPGVLSDEAVRTRFRKEALALARLNHPNIATIYDFDTQSGIEFLITEYIPGTTLSDMLLNGPLEQRETIRLGIQLCDGLAAAHEHNVVHRDLKPSNLRVTPEGRLKILDFGLARLLRPTGDTDLTQTITDTHSFAGTIPYMSPEQLRGERADPRNDVYAAGIVLYEMACGQRPFPQTRSAELIAAILNKTPGPPSSINHHVSTELDSVILKAIDKRPENRYQSAIAVVPDLERLGSPHRSPISPFQFVSNWRLAAALICVAVLLTFAGLWGRRIIHRPVAPPAENRTWTNNRAIPPRSVGNYVAVLPFKISGEDAPFREYLADGLSAALSTKLSRLKELRLATQEATSKIHEDDSSDKTARALGVNVIVGGTIQADAGGMEIAVNVVDPAKGKTIWTQRFAGLPNDLLKLEDQISEQLVTALGVTPSNDELAEMAERPTTNDDAYTSYLRGLHALATQDNPEDAEFAIEFFDQSIQKDPNFALAYIGVADASMKIYQEKKGRAWSQKALAAARRAQQLNDKLPEAHFALSKVYFTTGKKTEAISELKQGLELSPNPAIGYWRLGNTYRAAGQKTEAIAAFKKAIEVNPYYWVLHRDLGRVYFTFGENENALEEFKRVAELQPESSDAWANVATTYERMGRYEDCIPLYKKAIEFGPSWLIYSNLGYVYTFLKRYPEAITALQKAVELGPNQEMAVGNLADAYRYSGQKDKADATYDKAIALTFKDLQANPRSTEAMGDLATYYAKKGDIPHAMEFIKRARAIDKNDVELIHTQAIIEVIANRRSDAMRTFREAMAKGLQTKEVWEDPEAARVRNSPEFQQLWSEYHKSK